MVRKQIRMPVPQFKNQIRTWLYYKLFCGDIRIGSHSGVKDAIMFHMKQLEYLNEKY